MSAVAVASEVQSPPARRIPPRGPRCGHNRQSPLTQAIDLKDLAYSTAKDSAVPAHIKAPLMRAWCDLHEITMAIRGQGKPKPVEAKNANGAKRTKEHAAPISAQEQTKATQPNTASSDS